jgi:beta-galactosidase
MRNGYFRAFLEGKLLFLQLQAFILLTFDCSAGGNVKVLGSGSLDIIGILPDSSKILEMPKFSDVDLSVFSEVWFTINFTHRDTTTYCPAGELVAWTQKQIVSESKKVSYPLSNTSSQPFVDHKLIRYEDDNMEFVFDKTKGSIVSWTVNDKPLIVEGDNNCLTFWRAPTSRGDRLNAAYWKNFGLDDMVTSIKSVKIVDPSASLLELQIQLEVCPKVLAWRFKITTNYCLYSDRLVIKSQVHPVGYVNQAIPKTIPRIGWEFGIPDDYEHCQWFGLGPGESYVDKRDASRVGIFESEVSKLDFEYEIPQENGNRFDTRWMWVGNQGSQSGLQVKAAKDDSEINFNFKISDQYDLDKSKHPFEVKHGKKYLRIDYAHHGAGETPESDVEDPAVVLSAKPMAFDIILEVSDLKKSV